MIARTEIVRSQIAHPSADLLARPDSSANPTIQPVPRILMFGGQSGSELYVLRALERRFPLVGVVWERRSRSLRLQHLLRRSRKMGWFYPLDRVLLSIYCRLVLKRSAALSPAWHAERSAQEYRPACPEFVVPWINHESVLAHVKECQPDIVVVSGTSIISRAVLQSAPVFINLHSGITPQYRGAHCGFWAAAHGDFQNIGVTLHRVDEGIDTGEVLHQERIEFDPSQDNLLTLAAKQTVAGAQMVVAWLEEHRSDFATVPGTTLPPGRKGKLYYSPGLRDYRRFERQLAASH